MPDNTVDKNCDHEWEYQDDSFDHEFGTEVIRFWFCEKCGITKDFKPSDLVQEP